MGGYNTTPKKEKTSTDETHEHLDFGVSGMQGWRMTMEDAHCCLTNVDGKGTNLFAVFDGHGGSEVAEYCALNFDKFLLDAEAYEEGNLEKSLKDTFMAIDEAIISPEVISELKELCGFEETEENAVDENAMLLEEANMPIEQLLERIKENTKDKLAEILKQDTKDGDKEDEDEKPLQNGHVEEKQEVKSGKRKQKKPSKRVLDEQESTNPKFESPIDKEKSSGTKDVAGGSALAAGSSAGEGDSLIKDSSSGGSVKFSLADLREEATANADGNIESGDEDDDDDDEEEDESDYEEDDDDEESGDEDDEFEDGQGFDFVQDTGYDVGYNSGTTAIVALLRGNRLYVGNVGDSRCVLCRDNKAFDMSTDHTPQDEKEKERIEAAGGKITADGRVNGGLNLTRAIGDHAFKANKDIPLAAQMISAYPDVRQTTLTNKDDFMVLACDGIWNVMSSEEVVQFVRSRLVNKNTDEDVKLSKICEEMFDRCMAPNTDNDGAGCDNMTCIIIRFKHDEQGNLKVNGQTKRTRTSNSHEDPQSSEKSKKAKLTQ